MKIRLDGTNSSFKVYVDNQIIGFISKPYNTRQPNKWKASSYNEYFRTEQEAVTAVVKSHLNWRLDKKKLSLEEVQDIKMALAQEKIEYSGGETNYGSSLIAGLMLIGFGALLSYSFSSVYPILIVAVLTFFIKTGKSDIVPAFSSGSYREVETLGPYVVLIIFVTILIYSFFQ